MAGFDKEMWQDFVVEVQENLEELEPNLLLLEQQPNDISILNDCFRNMHSIKGAANYMGFENIATLAHRLENLLDSARQKKASLGPAAFDLIFKSVDRFRQLLKDIDENHKETLGVDDLIRHIDALDSNGEGGPGIEAPREALQEEKSGIEEDASLGEDPELLNIFQEEMKSLFAQLSSVCQEGAQVGTILGLLDDMERVTNYMGKQDMLDQIKRVKEAVKDKDKEQLDLKDAEEIKESIYQVLVKEVGLEPEDFRAQDTGVAAAFEEDQELYKIFLDFFQEVGAPLASIPETFDQAWMEGCERAIERLKSSANYMDYMDVVRILEEWEERFAEVLSDQKGFEPGVFRQLWEKLTDTLPGLEELFAEDMQSAPVQSDAFDIGLEDIFPEAEQEPGIQSADFEGLDSAIDSMLSPQIDGDIHSIKAGVEEAQGQPSDSNSTKGSEPVEAGESSQVKARQFHELPDKPSEVVSRPADSGVDIQAKTVRVNLDKVENLLEDVAELVVLRSAMSRATDLLDNLYSRCLDQRMLPIQELRQMKEILLGFSENVAALERIVHQLQDGVMRIRMLPVSHIFNRYPRMIRDLSKRLNKEVELVLQGMDTVLDKQVMEHLVDPLQHIVRNALDHGLETPEERKKQGKPPKGKITITASQEGNFVVITVADDGRGLDKDAILKRASSLGLVSPELLENLSETQAMNLIFLPGVSTAEKVSEISGRGVGLDVVKRNIERAGGTISVRSQRGKGTVISIRIPLTLAIIRGLVVRVGAQAMVIPVSAVYETFRLLNQEVSQVEGYEMITRRQQTLPLIRLGKIFRGTGEAEEQDKFFAVRVRLGEMDVCLGVDALVGQQEVVIKPLSEYLMDQPGFAGATILGDGSIALILDLTAVLEKSKLFIQKRQQILEQQALGYNVSSYSGLIH